MEQTENNISQDIKQQLSQEAQLSSAQAEVSLALQTPNLDREHQSKSNIKGKRIFVGNLSANTSWQDLKDFFRQIGDVLYAQVYQASQGRRKYWGIVQFRTAEEAKKAIQDLNRGVIDGREITVREDREEAGQEIQTQNLGQSLVRQGRGRGRGYGRGRGGYGRQGYYEGYGDQMYDYGYAYGPYQGGYAPYGAQYPPYGGGFGRGRGVRGRGRGFGGGYMDYDMEYDRSYGYQGGRSQVSYPPQGGEMGQGQTQVVVHGLPYRFSWQDLKDLFASDIQDVQHADVMIDMEGRSKGYGTVRFRSRESAMEAIEKFNQFDLHGRLLTVKFDRFAY